MTVSIYSLLVFVHHNAQFFVHERRREINVFLSLGSDCDRG